jgi:hypothetical protein
MTNFGRRRKVFERSLIGTWSIVGLIGIGFLLSFFSNGQWFAAAALPASGSFTEPWRLFTYAAVSGPGAFIGTLLVGYWAYVTCPFLEREVKTAGLLAAFLSAVVGTGLMFAVGNLIEQGARPLYGAWPAIVALTVVWCSRSPEMVIRVFFCIPIKLKWLALVLGLGIFFSYGTTSLAVGSLMVLPILAAWLWGLDRLPVPYGRPKFDKARLQKKEDTEFHDFMDKVREKEQDRKEREELKRLLESSLDDDQDA